MDRDKAALFQKRKEEQPTQAVLTWAAYLIATVRQHVCYPTAAHVLYHFSPDHLLSKSGNLDFVPVRAATKSPIPPANRRSRANARRPGTRVAETDARRGASPRPSPPNSGDSDQEATSPALPLYQIGPLDFNSEPAIVSSNHRIAACARFRGTAATARRSLTRLGRACGGAFRDV